MIEGESFLIIQLKLTYNHLQQWTDLCPCWFQPWFQLEQPWEYGVKMSLAQ